MSLSELHSLKMAVHSASENGPQSFYYYATSIADCYRTVNDENYLLITAPV